jgi:hypothetical protein
MRHPSLRAAAALVALTSVAALTTLTACEKPAPAHDDLAADLASLSSSNDLALAPSGAGRSTVSAAEQLAPHTTVAPSRRSTPHRTPHVTRHASKTPRVIAPEAQPVSEPAPEPMTTVASAPMPVMAPRPHPVTPSSSPGNVAGIPGNDMPNGGVGQTIGTIIGVVLRGGVADGDHCDPRAGRHPRPPVYGGPVRPQVRY